MGLTGVPLPALTPREAFAASLQHNSLFDPSQSSLLSVVCGNGLSCWARGGSRVKAGPTRSSGQDWT